MQPLPPRNPQRAHDRAAQHTRKDYAPPLVDAVGGSRRRALLFGSVFVVALAAFIALLAFDESPVEPTTAIATTPIEQIVDDPARFDGLPVTVIGTASDGAAGQAAFSLSDGDVLDRDRLLVVNRGAQPTDVDADRWRATGRVQVYDGEPIEGRQTVVGDIEVGQPILIARTVAAVPPPTVGW